MEIGQDVRRLLEEAMKLIESNRSSMEKANGRSLRMHPGEPQKSPAMEITPAAGRRMTSANHKIKLIMQVNYEN